MSNWFPEQHHNVTIQKAGGVRYGLRTPYFYLLVERASKSTRKYKFRFYSGFVMRAEAKETFENDDEAKIECMSWFNKILEEEIDFLQGGKIMMKEYLTLINSTDEELNNVIKTLEGKGRFPELAAFLLASNEKLSRRLEKLEKFMLEQNEDTFW